MNGADRKASEALQLIAEHVEDLLTAASGQKLGFCLVVFPVETNSRASYISNCDRKEVIEALNALLERWSDGMPDVPAHKVQ